MISEVSVQSWLSLLIGACGSRAGNVQYSWEIKREIGRDLSPSTPWKAPSLYDLLPPTSPLLKRSHLFLIANLTLVIKICSVGHYDNISDPNDSRQAGQNLKKSYISKPKDIIVILKIFLEYNHRGGKKTNFLWKCQLNHH